MLSSFRLFYAGRRSIFLPDPSNNANNNGVAPSAILPMSTIMKTKKVVPVEANVGSTKNDSMKNGSGKQGPILPQILKQKSIKADESRFFRKTVRMIKKAIVIDHKPDSWERENHGGVKMWVNQKTGEVSLERPEDAVMSVRKAGSHQGPKSVRGTASILYNGQEMEDLYSMLDSKSFKCKPKRQVLPPV